MEKPVYLTNHAHAEHTFNISNSFLNPPGEIKKEKYTNQNVKTAIDLLTNKKCGYCGASTATGVQRDVDHFRPAREVKYSDSRQFERGYYWLTAEWDNLLPSCHPCNSPINFEVFDYEDRKWKTLGVGKDTHFPVDTPPTSSPSHLMQLANEVPLLFNPCEIDPKDLFDYMNIETSRLNIIFLQPKNGLSNLQEKIAKKSIRILGLNRLPLCKNRFIVYEIVKKYTGGLKQVFFQTTNKKLIADELARLLPYITPTHPDSEFIGMIWSKFNSEFESFSIELNKLENTSDPVSNEEQILSVMISFKEKYFITHEPTAI